MALSYTAKTSTPQRQASNFSRMFVRLIESLLGLATICKSLSLYQVEEKFIKKALQYAWYKNHTDYELQIYDEMGKMYYLMGYTQLAKEFHLRYATASAQSNRIKIKN